MLQNQKVNDLHLLGIYMVDPSVSGHMLKRHIDQLRNDSYLAKAS